MIFTAKPKKIRVMLTVFRDGLQSVFGGKVRTSDILPAMQAAAKMGFNYLEFGGGARYQAPFFYAGESPFESMQQMRDAVGPGVDLQILTRSVSGVTLTTQRLDALALQARLMKKYGTTIDRNFDYMNDVENLVKTGQPIVDAGMHHQVCVAMMGLPFASKEVHTPEFYVQVVKKLLKSGLHFDSVCMKDASGTTDPHTCFETANLIKKALPPEVPLSMHTHDTASMAVACYMAGIAGGVDWIDLSLRPLASGTAQPDVRSMWHALKGTGYSLDLDTSGLEELENLITHGLREYEFNPVTTSPDARVVNFPMPGGAIGPNVHMMKEAGILDRYSEVLAEFPEVVRAGGAWTSVTPGSQQYWLQAFNNVLHGRWKKIESGYGRAALGYFGKTPLPADAKVVKIASEQLGLKPFTGDPLAEAADSLALAKKALLERNLDTSDENIFLVASSFVPGKNPDLNEGIRYITGKAKINLPLLVTTEASKTTVSSAPTTGLAQTPITTTCVVEEGNVSRQFKITIEPSGQTATNNSINNSDIQVFSPFSGKLTLVELNVKVGDKVSKDKVVAAVEAMKAKHDVRSPADGTVKEINASLGDTISGDTPILTLTA